MLRICNNRLAILNSPKVFPITYIMTDEVKSTVEHALQAAVLLKDCERIKYLFLKHRPCELSLNELYNDKTIIMTLSTMDCIDNHHPCELIEFLVMSGANIDERDSAGSTALMEAVKIGKYCTAKKLIELGCAVDALDIQEENALFKAFRHCPNEKLAEIISLLVFNGIAVNRYNVNEHLCNDVAQYLQKLCYYQFVTDQVQRFQNAFWDHMKKVVPEHWDICSKIIDFQYFQVIPGIEWYLSFTISELGLPDGSGGFLFMALISFNEHGIEFKSGNNIPVQDVYFNGRILQSHFPGTKDILWLSPLIQGLNKMVIKMKQVNLKGNMKVALQANVAIYDHC